MSTDLTKLETELLAEIAAAADLTAIEAVRVSALGKKGRVSELMSKLGSLPADERKAFGQSVNTLKAKVTGALEARKDVLETAALDVRLKTERADVTLPVRPGPLAEGRIHPVSQVLRRGDRDLRRHGLQGRRRSRHRDRRDDTSTSSTFRRSIPRGRSTTRSISAPGQGRAALVAHAYQPGADPHDGRRSRRSASSRPAASIAATATRRTRRCSIRSKGSSSTRRPTWVT
jgi:hypothetical protein